MPNSTSRPLKTSVTMLPFCFFAFGVSSQLHFTLPSVSLLLSFYSPNALRETPYQEREMEEKTPFWTFRTGASVCWYGQRRHYRQWATQNTKGQTGKEWESRDTVQVEKSYLLAPGYISTLNCKDPSASLPFNRFTK